MNEGVPGQRKFEELPEKKLARQIVAAIDKLVADLPMPSSEEIFEKGEFLAKTREFNLADGRRVIVGRDYPELNDELHESEELSEEMVAQIYILESEHLPEKRSMHIYVITRDNMTDHVFNPPGASGGNNVHDLLAQARSEKAQREMGLTRVSVEELQKLLALVESLR